MAKQQANKGDRGGLVSRSSMERIGRAVAAYERGNRDRKPQAMPRAWGDDGGDPIRIGKTTAKWDKNTLATIKLYESGTPPSEASASPPETLEDCVNKFANIPADSWVCVAKAKNGSWYLIAAECK
jgi:hypothetical protein